MAMIPKRSLLLLALAGAVRLAFAQPRSGAADYNGFDVRGALVPLDAIERLGIAVQQRCAALRPRHLRDRCRAGP